MRRKSIFILCLWPGEDAAHVTDDEACDHDEMTMPSLPQPSSPLRQLPHPVPGTPSPERAFKRTYVEHTDLTVKIPETRLEERRSSSFQRGGVTVFIIKLRDARHKINWQVDKRFSDFGPLREAITEVHGPTSVPALPGKRVIVVGAASAAAVVEERRKKLEHFLQAAIAVEATEGTASGFGPLRDSLK